MKGFAKLCSWGTLFLFMFVQTLCAVGSVPSDALQHRKDTLNRNSEQVEKDSTYVKNLMLQRKHKHLKLTSDLQGLA
jgi:hypothetical protein